MSRTRLNLQLEKSVVEGSIVITDAAKEAIYLAPGAANEVLTSDGTTVSFQPVPGSSTNVSDGTTVASFDAGDTLTFSDQGVKATVSKTGSTVSVLLAVDPSVDASNALVLGTDGKPYVPKAQLVTGSTWSDATNELTISFADGSSVVIPIVDAIGTFISDFVISDGTTTATINNHGTVTYSGTNLVKATVGAGTVTVGLDTTGSTAGQYIESTGASTAPVWKTPLVATRDIFPTASLTIGGNSVTLTGTPAAGSQISVHRNGLLDTDYTVLGSVITFTVAFGASTGAVFSESVVVDYFV